MFKNGYYGNGGLIFAWDLGASYLGVPNLRFRGLKKVLFLILGLKGAKEKRVGCLLVYLF